MAQRKYLYHPEEVKEKIKTTQLINRLQDHALGEIDLSPTQLRAAEILIKKVVPDTSAVTVSGDQDAPLKTTLEVTWKAPE